MSNKRGSIGIVIVASVFVFIVGMGLINLLIPEVSDFRINMNCADAESISDGTKLLCLVGGISIPYWIFIILSITIGGILSRVI